ncbi:twin-arginine translocase subunit TatC [Guyparkeria sp.]|uniref:twin-arginine translocase subunit TatC n=1 Tax=Guyparkeria sp. TaxID=2035736 RepID=UPI0039711634
MPRFPVNDDCSVTAKGPLSRAFPVSGGPRAGQSPQSESLRFPDADGSPACSLVVWRSAPSAITFMQGFLSHIVQNQWTLDNYIDFVTRVLFWMGIVFQTPLLMFFLAKLNIITAEKLAKARRYAIVATAIIAAFVTPTPDPINMVIVMVPLYLLYELGVILARLARVGMPDEERQLTTTSAQ